MKVQNLSVKRLFGRVAIGLVPEGQIGRCKDSDRSNGIRSLSDRAGSEINTVTVRREWI